MRAIGLAWREHSSPAQGQGTRPGHERVQERAAQQSHREALACLAQVCIRASLLGAQAGFAGGVAGGQSTSVLSLHLRSFLGHMRQCSGSSALVFVDVKRVVKSAFYSIMREFALGDDHRLDQFTDTCSRLGLAADQLQARLLHCPGAGAGQDALTRPFAVHMVSGARLRKSCVNLRWQLSGGALADMLFGMLLTGPLKQLAQELQDQGLCPSLHTAGVLLDSAESQVCAPVVSWHDDLVLLLATPRASDLLPEVSFALRNTHNLLAARNLQVNLLQAKLRFCVCRLGLVPLRLAKGCELLSLTLAACPLCA